MGSTIDNFIDKSNGEYNLHIKAGQSLEIAAIDYFFDNVIIEENGQLIVTPNSENWVLIDCRQDFTLEGSIIYRKFIADTTSRELKVNNIPYIHAFKQDNLGGDGGNSGFQDLTPKSTGAKGSTTYGGGGGSGAYFHRRSRNTLGANGNQNLGGVTSFSYGGNGAIRKKYCSGGLLFLNIGHDFFIGEKNLIDLRGEDGENGLNGKAGSGSVRSMSCIQGSGGGGGAPGGEGGVLYHKVGGNYAGHLLKALVTGGIGGVGGKGGRFPENDFPSGHGLDGGTGENGRTGFVKIVR